MPLTASGKVWSPLWVMTMLPLKVPASAAEKVIGRANADAERLFSSNAATTCGNSTDVEKPSGSEMLLTVRGAEPQL